MDFILFIFQTEYICTVATGSFCLTKLIKCLCTWSSGAGNRCIAEKFCTVDYTKWRQWCNTESRLHFCIVAGALKQINTHSPAAFRKFNSFYDQCLMFDSIVNKTSRLEESE